MYSTINSDCAVFKINGAMEKTINECGDHRFLLCLIFQKIKTESELRDFRIGLTYSTQLYANDG